MIKLPKCPHCNEDIDRVNYEMSGTESGEITKNSCESTGFDVKGGMFYAFCPECGEELEDFFCIDDAQNWLQGGE